MDRRKAIEIGLRRRAGASPEVRARIEQAANEWNDWRGQCARCGHPRRGHISELCKPCPQCGFGGHDAAC